MQQKKDIISEYVNIKLALVCNLSGDDEKKYQELLLERQVNDAKYF